MPVVVIANPKGGVGKSTLSTQIAGYFASRGHAVLLGDADRQQSSKLWHPPDGARSDSVRCRAYAGGAGSGTLATNLRVAGPALTLRTAQPGAGLPLCEAVLPPGFEHCHSDRIG